MPIPNGRKIREFVFLLCAATTIASPAQTFTTLVNFDGIHGYDAEVAPVQGVDGRMYGTTIYGGDSGCDDAYGFGCGVVYRVGRREPLTVLYNFSDTDLSNGIYPGPLVLATDGSFYGTTEWGGTNNADSCYDYCGTMFRINTRGKLTTVYNFCAQANCADGISPGGFVQGADGNFYGTTWQGGTGTGFCSEGGKGGCGTVFKITPTGVLTTLYSFCSQPNCSDGANPVGLVLARDGNFYGTTYSGGDLSLCFQMGCGTVFKITAEGQLTTLYSFCAQTNCADGVQPSGIIQALDGRLYGTTGGGGDTGEGTVFSVSLRGVLKTLHNFCTLPDCSDGREPVGGVMQATDGNFYGPTPFGGIGGKNGQGTIFSITPRARLITLHNFTSGGANPFYPPTQGTDGILYGTTPNDEVRSDGGCPPYGCGTLYSLNMGLAPFVAFVFPAGRVGRTGGILGQGFTGTTSVMLNGVPLTFVVVSDTYIRATVPVGATTGYVIVTTPTGILKSNVPFRVIP